MTESQAQLLNAIVGVSVGLACFWLLGRLGAPDNIVLLEAMLTIVVPAFGVGLVGRHYERKEIERGEDPDDF